jgi:hypothetical protein
MTSPNPPRKEDDKLRQHLEKGGKVTLESQQTFQSSTETIDTRPVTVTFIGSEDLATKLTGRGKGVKVRANLSFTHQETPNFVVLAFLNSPRANASTPITDPGYLGPVAFFAHNGETHHETTVARLSAGNVTRKTGRKGAITLTLVPVGFPGRTIKAQAMQVSATLEVLLSTVEKVK